LNDFSRLQLIDDLNYSII